MIRGQRGPAGPALRGRQEQPAGPAVEELLVPGGAGRALHTWTAKPLTVAAISPHLPPRAVVALLLDDDGPDGAVRDQILGQLVSPGEGVEGAHEH